MNEDKRTRDGFRAVRATGVFRRGRRGAVAAAIAGRLRAGGSLGAILAGTAAGAALLALWAAPSAASVASTKHNLGSLSPAEVRTSETTEICIFCHTPHNAEPTGPLWNRQASGATYNVYASSTLAATLSPNAPQLGQPTGSSKLCLSCHDGTIAVGAVLNRPGKGQPLATPTPFAVTGPGVDASGLISTTSTSYIGTELRDDHPISFSYNLSYPSNTEIKAPITLPPEVKLDSANMVQCVSCHDPHGTPYPKFLVKTLDGGALCTACHAKRYWNTNPAVHNTSMALWNGTGQNPWKEDLGVAGFTDDTPQLQSCLACHSSHGGVAGKSLLRGTNPVTQTVDGEEWTCLNCHNGNVAAKDIDATLSHLYTHDVKGGYGLHTPSRQLAGDPAREDATNIAANRHVECSDCHNGHAAMSGNHTVGGSFGNIIAPNLLGSWGVKPSPWGAAGTVATNYNIIDFTSTLPGGNNLEGYLCLKCHSYYAYGFNPVNVPSGNADGSLVRQSDPTADFNPSNAGYHPVFAPGKNAPPATANPNWPANGLGLTNTFTYVEFPGIGTRTGFFNVRYDSTITCSDCHASSMPGDPKGPHGSNERWLLTKKEVNAGIGTQKNFCYNCHRRDVYGDEGFIGPEANFSRVPHPVDGLGLNSPFYQTGPGLGNNGNKFLNLCLTCHGGAYDSLNNVMKGIHGSNAAAGSVGGVPTGQALGLRLMNGACVESHTPATTTTGVQMTFRAVNTATDPVCSANYSSFTGNTANYNCNAADCSF